MVWIRLLTFFNEGTKPSAYLSYITISQYVTRRPHADAFHTGVNFEKLLWEPLYMCIHTLQHATHRRVLRKERSLLPETFTTGL